MNETKSSETGDMGGFVEIDGVQLKLSLHLGPVNFNNQPLGTFYVPKNGKKVVQIFNPAGAIVQAVMVIYGVILWVTTTVTVGPQRLSKTIKQRI